MKGAVIRTFAHETLVAFANAAPRLCVVNALTDQEHPCQALADFPDAQYTGATPSGRTVTFVGDGNNVATSLAQAGVMLGVNVRIASPEGYELPDRWSSTRRRGWRATARRFGCSAIRSPP